MRVTSNQAVNSSSKAGLSGPSEEPPVLSDDPKSSSQTCVAFPHTTNSDTRDTLLSLSPFHLGLSFCQSVNVLIKISLQLAKLLFLTVQFFLQQPFSLLLKLSCLKQLLQGKERP